MENLANKICQPTKAELLSQLEPILTYIQQEAPLIHCITNPISINDCANILLAIGARLLWRSILMRWQKLLP